MRNKNKEIVFSNGDPMKPVFCLDGKKYYTDKDVERLIEEYDDRLRVARGNFNLVETLNSFVERDLIEKAWKFSQRSLFLSRYGIAIAWYAKWGRENPDKIFFMNGRTFGWLKEHWKKVGLYWKKKYDEACR